MTMEQKAVFVYGSLLEGLHNYERCLKGKVSKIIPAKVKGFELYSVYDSYPAMVKNNDGEVVKGELMILKEEEYFRTLKVLDNLEGYNPKNKRQSLYLRETREIQLDNGAFVEAYVYIWNRSTKGLAKVKGDSWKNYILSKIE